MQSWERNAEHLEILEQNIRSTVTEQAARIVERQIDTMLVLTGCTNASALHTALREQVAQIRALGRRSAPQTMSTQQAQEQALTAALHEGGIAARVVWKEERRSFELRAYSPTTQAVYMTTELGGYAAAQRVVQGLIASRKGE